MYLDAKNLADAWLFLLRNVQPNGYRDGVARPTRYNIVGQEEITNLDLARRVAGILGKELKYRYEDFHRTRPGHDRRYALDGSRITELGWKHPIPFDETLKRVVDYSVDHPEWLNI
jgi:dTDP-glucose 4,6-dehydratase